jgi:DNA-binding SARP family transcriptional activator
VVHLSIGGVPLKKRIRRKVLGLLCFVACRPGFAATRDEALEALWSDLSPDTAVNSLHQTIYFLRRLFEPDYSEGMSAGYVQFDGEVLSLDTGLVETSSRRCWALLTDWSAGNSTAIDRLLDAYTGKFALDFAYEDWATAYRDNLHAAVLAAAETEIEDRVDHGRVEEAIALAQRVLAIDPMADSIELRLLRAYKRGGRLAAAAEQYAHYATIVRDELGAEPPPYSDI